MLVRGLPLEDDPRARIILHLLGRIALRFRGLRLFVDRFQVICLIVILCAI